MQFCDLKPSVVLKLATEIGAPPDVVGFLVETSREYRAWDSDVKQEPEQVSVMPPDLDERVERATMRWEMYFPTPPILSLPWPHLGEIVGPLHAGDVLVVAAGPGVGKTTFSTNLLAALTPGQHRALVIGTETPKREWLMRVSAIQLGLTPDDVVESQYLKASQGHCDAERVRDALITRMSELMSDDPGRPMMVVRRMRVATSELGALFTTVCGRYRRNIILVDHVKQLVHDGLGSHRAGTIAAEHETFDVLKELAVQHQCVVILMTQVNTERMVGGDPTKRFDPPQLEHVYGGQKAGHIASVGISLYRPLRERFPDATEWHNEIRALMSTKPGAEPIDVRGERISRKLHLPEVSRGTIPYGAVVMSDCSGFYCMKHRRARGRLYERRTLPFRDGFILADEAALVRHTRRIPLQEAGDAYEEET